MQDISKLIEFYKAKIKIFKLIVFMILFVFLFSQVIFLTKFLYNYNYYFDYGKMLKNLCKDAYTEYETPRFQLFNRSILVRLSGDEYDAANIYNTIILIAVIIVVLYVAVMFWCFYIYITVDNFENFQVEKICSKLKSLKPWKWLLVILSLYIILIIPIYIILKLTNTADISPFQMQDAQLGAHITLMGIIMISLLIFIYIDINKELDGKGKAIYIIKYILIVLFVSVFYVVSCYILTVICDVYTRPIFKYKPGEDGFKQQYNVPQQYDLLQNFFGDIFGINDFSKFATDNFKSNKNVIPILFFIIALFAIIVLVLHKWVNQDISNMIYYFALLPFFILFIIVFMGVLHIQYNTYINRYLLFEPELLYKQILGKINSIFNQILVNDKSNILDKSVCFNVANAIQLSIYTDLFNKGSIENNKVNTDLKSLFTPAFKFTRGCDDTMRVEYNEIETYNIDYYINDDRNMFYVNNRDCSGIRNGLLYVLMMNCHRVKGDDKASRFENWLRFAVNNIYNLRNNYTYAETDTDKGDFEDVSIQATINIYDGNHQSQKKFGKHIDGVIADVVAKYDTYLWNMHLEVIKTVRALCQCNGLPDITNNTALFKGQLGTYIISETDGTRSKNIKKDFINIFVVKTSHLLSEINKLMSSQVVTTDNNYRLTKLIIKNYNKTHGSHEEGSNKFIYNRLFEQSANTSVQKQETIFSNKFNHIENIEALTSNIIFSNSDNVQQVQKEFNNFKNEYELVYKESTMKEMLYKYKCEYMESNITTMSIRGSNMAEDYKVNYKVYSDKFDNLKSISQDHFKNELITEMNRLPDDIESTAKSIAKAANTSSELTYFVFIIYIAVVILTIGAVR